MPTIAVLVTELSLPAYAPRVASGANGELVTQVNIANPFPQRFRSMSVDEFKAIVAGELIGLTSTQREVLRILLQGDSVNLGDTDVRTTLSGIFADPIVRTALTTVAREDDLVTLRGVREAVRQIPSARINQPTP